MTSWLADFQYGARMILKRPGTSSIAIVALALGIGLTAVMFSIVQGAILRGLPFPEGDRIMLVSRARLSEPGSRASVPVDDFLDWRERQQSFEGLAAFGQDSVVISGDSGFPERFDSSTITPNTLSLLNVQPAMGRDFTEADAAPGAPPVALISHRVWTSRFGGDRSAIGQDLRVDGTLTTIVGVMPEGFGFPQTGELWQPRALERPEQRGQGPTARVIGRLKDGVSEREAAVEMAGIAAQLAETHEVNKDITATLGPYVKESIGDEVVATLFTMLGAVFGVMLIACVNVTNLQLARAAERTKEVAIRTALGAGRWRIVRQLLAEGLLLSAVGALFGLGIAWFGTAAFMRAIVDTQPPFWIDVRLDPTVILFVTGITVAAALVSSVLPGWRVARADPNLALKDDTRGATGLRMGVFSRWLVVVEVTASCVLLVVSGLMIRSIVATSRFDYPFATEDVFYARLSLAATTDRALQLEQLEQRLARIPGVQRVALANNRPGQTGDTLLSIEGVPDGPEAERPRAMRATTSAGYFDVLRVTPIVGRVFTEADRTGTLEVAVVDAAFVARHLAEGSPIGRRIRLGNDEAPWLTVIGVVPDLVGASQNGDRTETAYVSMAQFPSSSPTILASTAGDPVAITSAVRAAVVEIDDQGSVSEPNSLAGVMWLSAWPFRVFGGLFLTFGVAALVLAAAGLYGVMSFSVRRRTQEIGVRMALGAGRRSVLTMILWQGLWRVALGVAVGLVPGYFVGTLMGALLVNASPSDPLVHGVTAATLLGTGLLASLAPALRAASVNPLTALRRD